MTIRCALVAVALAACGAPDSSPGDDHPDGDITPDPGVRAIYDAVTEDNIKARLDELTGATQVTAGGQTFAITDRWSPAAKARFRAYWTKWFTDLGATVTEQTFPIPNLVGETVGHNVEAVLPGESADSMVIIVHYDTVGIEGKETQNPGADDDGSGLAMQLEAGKIFAAHAKRKLTVRFVAADYEEISDDLDGDYAYVKYLQDKAKAEGFAIVVASDNDQTGWSCWSEGRCGANPPPEKSTFQMISCSGDAKHYDHQELARGMAALSDALATPIKPTAVCDGSGDTDHYPFWVAGIPAYVIEEYGSENNPHYDDTGDDTMAHIDLPMLANIAKLQIAFQAQLAGIE